jgi:hypothetical protein
MDEDVQTQKQTETDVTTQQQGALPPAAANLQLHTMSIGEKAKYGLSIGIPSVLGLEILGAGGTGLVVATILALTAGYWSEEIRDGIIDRLPVPKQHATSRQNKISWWLTGRGDELVVASEAEEPDTEPLGAQRVPEDMPDLPMKDKTAIEPISEKLLAEKLLDGSLSTGPANILKLGRVVKTQRRFDPLMKLLLGIGLLLAGRQGMGKSNIIGLIAYSAGKCGRHGMPLVVIDYKGEFYTLCAVVPNGIRAGHPSLSEEAGPGFFPLTVGTAVELAKIVMEGPFQVVIDIPSYNSDGDEIAEVLAAFLHGLMDWSRKQKEDDRIPCLVITDEAHHFLPQQQNRSGLVMIDPKKGYGAMKKAYSRLANTGRSFGFTLVMATQRLPLIDKGAIGNLGIKVIMGHTVQNDLDACEEETGGLIDSETIKALEPGVGIVVGLTKEPTVVQFDEQPARHVSVTPNIERLDRQFDGTPKPRLSRVLAQRNHHTNHRTVQNQGNIDREASFSNLIPASQMIPLSLQEYGQEQAQQAQQVLDLPRPLPAVRSSQTSASMVPAGNSKRLTIALSPELQQAYDAFQDGFSHRDLGRVLEISHGTAGKLIQRLEDKGLILKENGRKIKVGSRG